MDINDDYNPRRIQLESTISQRHHDKEDAENHLVGNYNQQQQHARLETSGVLDLSAMKNRGIYDGNQQEKHHDPAPLYYQDHHHHDDMDNRREIYADNIRMMSYGGGKSTSTGESFNDVLNSNRQNMEGGQLTKNVGNPYDKYSRVHNLPMLSEDLRISKIIRRLMIENNRNTAIDLCQKLETAVRNQSNASYICRSFDILFDNMLSVLRQCPLECLENASYILGVMGYINRYNFAIYKGHLTKAYGTYKNIRKYLMMALKTTLKCDAVNLDLKTYSDRLLGLLKEYLENAEIADNFISISETIAEFSKNYKQSFQRHFTDIVDIIIGWHIEVEQPAKLKRHCAKILQQFAVYFLSELDFTFGLLGQFIEDMEACREELISEDCTTKMKQQTENRVGAFIGAFTSIVKALASKGVNLNEFDTAANILINAKDVVHKVAKQCFLQVPLISEETVLNLNEFYCIILLYDKSVENLYDFEGIIELQLKHLAGFNDNQRSSFLFMILNIVRQYRTQLPLSFVSLIMKTDYDTLQDLKLSCGSKTCKLLMKIYHEILIIKNVPLLQEAYRHIITDVNNTIKNLNSSPASSSLSSSQHSMMRNEMILNFYLASIAALACQTSSIIGMYALNPSILELLINNCQASNSTIWSKYPTLHEALLELIIDHSTKNHNFRQSSRLLTKKPQDSPSSENFAMILKFLNELLKWHVTMNTLKWLEQILDDCREDYEILIQKDDFLNICENLTLVALKEPLICSTILEALLKYPKIPESVLTTIKDIALIVIIESSDTNLSSSYCKILALLPLEICLTTANRDKELFSKNKEKLFILYQWHKSSVYFNPLRPKYFKPFLESMDPNSSTTNILYHSFAEKSSCYLQRDNFMEYLQSLEDNYQLISYHLQYEAARYCVQQKLRTTLGKPQETFLGIEAIIMKYARFLAEKDGLPLPYKNLQNVMDVQQNCRMLLGFLENLEKHIYNAAEGTAYAMLPAEKPAKTFFRVNAPTCREWFKRIRTAVNLIALHSMEPELVIRYSENILQIEANLNNQALLDRTVTSLVWALYNCGESDTIYGLIAWLKTKYGKRYEWIQYVAEQAAGHLEKAATGYLYTLHDENNKIIDSYMKEFIQKQLTECFYHTARWSEIANVTQENVYSKEHLEIMESIYQNAEDITENKELSKALIDLTEWPDEMELETKKKYTPKLETFSYYEILRKLQDSCIVETKCNEMKEGLYESIRKSIQLGIRESLIHSYEPGFNNNQLNELIIINHVSHKLHEKEDIRISTTDKNLDVKMSSLLLTKSLYWSLIRGPTTSNKQQYNLLLNLSSKARLENNLNYCQSLLTQFFKMKSINLPLNDIAQQLKSKQLLIDCNDLELIQGIEELVKCIQAQTTSISDALELGSACCSEIIQQSNKDPETATYPSSISNLLITMADWLTIHRLNNSNLINGQQFHKLQNQLPEIQFCSHSENSKCNLLPSSEYSIGKLLNASILCQKDSGEAWLSFGNWCYRWGKKLMESKQLEQSASTSIELRDIKLTKRNVSSIQDLLKDKFDPEAIQLIVDLLNTHILNAINDDNVEDLYSNSQNTTEILEAELKNICSLSVDQLNAIVSIWRQAHKGVYGFYEEATRAYFKYLAIESETAAVTKQSKCDDEEVDDCTFVTTTLRLLRLIVKHAIGLQDVLEEGLRNTPLRPWKVIVPQLFSRLNHHEPYVRQSVSELLCRLAVNQPQLIIFPAVVGAQQELKHRANTDTQVQLTNCFGTLLNSLAQQASETVLQVQLLVKELRRITLLWEEYWIHSLAQLYSEYSPLYNALDAEAKKSNNSELMQTKYEIFRHHLLTDFKQIATVTDKEAETNYERTFQERFKPHIELVLKELQRPLETSKPSELWQKVKQLYTIFQQRPLRGNSSTLRISDISPVLANMHNTTIAMPGVDTYEQPAVYIKSVDVTVFILPTKTKPKKLSLYGSNGQRYTYLFKGQEDLHLDERIMQFLSISNSMMARSYGSKSKTDCFKAHHYSVIPLGSQSGLISWVDNCTPLFAIYKKWQQRDAQLKQQQKERQSSAKQHEPSLQSPVAANATRPSELFYNKLTPLLAECNLKVSDPRKQWPMPVLKRVLKELTTDTPKDLLAKEIWCYSANAVEWRKSVRRYSMSMAVMSIIGYVIGLGDRHLDNVLIKLATGEIVHIDYNVCFEKGKTLRVPEKVPFRMTQNLKDALGLVGTEGAFRLACSHVLKILRKERETLLTLLEAFVYDPLVDWTVSDDGTTTVSRGTSAHTAATTIASLDVNTTVAHNMSAKDLYKNRKIEVDLSRQTLALRITEIKPAWMKYKNDFDLQLTDVDLHLQTVMEYRANILELEHERDSFTKQQAMVRELEALGSARGSHALNTVTQRYKVYKSDLESFNKVKSLIQQTVNDFDLVLVTYFNILLNTEEITRIEVNPRTNDNSNVASSHNESEFDLIQDLLFTNNFNHLYNQAKFTKHEMENSFIQIQRSALECRDLLIFYSRVMQFQPRAQLQSNHLIRYKKYYSNLIDLSNKSKTDLSGGSSMMNTKLNVEYCRQYFEYMTMITMDLQKNIVQAKHLLEEHKNQPIMLSTTAMNAINEFMSSNPSYNNEILIISMLRHILQASQVFHLHEQSLLQNRDYFLLNQQLNFLQLIDKFTNSIYNSLKHKTQNPAILNLLITCLKSLSYLRVDMESTIGQIFSIYMMDDNLELQKCLSEFVISMDLSILENCPKLCGIFEIVDGAFAKFELTLKAVQQKLLYIQDAQENAENELLMNSWNIDITNYLRKSRNDLVIKLFTSSKHNADSLINNNIDNIYDIRKIRYPIDDFIYHLESTLFDGLLPFVIQDINTNITNTIKPLESVNEMDLTNGDLLYGNLYVSLQHEFLIQCDESLILHHSKLLEQHQIVSTAYYWSNEEYLKDVIDVPHNFITTKREFLSRLHNISQVLVVWKSTMLKIQTDLDIHRNSVRDLLQTSPDVNDELFMKQQQFDQLISIINQRYSYFLNLSTSLTEYSAVLLQFEVSTGEQAFEKLVKHFEDERQKLQQSENSITLVERNLVQLLDPEDKIDQCWIQNVSGLLDEMIFSVQKKICDVEREMQSMEKILLGDGQQLQFLLDSSVRLDLRQLLKMLTKSYKQTSKADSVETFQDLRDIQQSLKLLQAKLNELQAQLFSRELDANSLQQIQEKVEELRTLCQKNNDCLNTLIERFLQMDMEREQQQQQRSDSPAISPSRNEIVNKEVVNSQIGEQKRNAYAVSVWKRIRMKLEGRDPDPNRRSSVAEQVDFVIREATNEENLASLYEGWTPWV